MKELSPEAQAVLWAGLNRDSDRLVIAAALRAAADQVVPQPPKNWDLISTVAARECEIRKNLIAIAAELDNSFQPLQ